MPLKINENIDAPISIANIMVDTIAVLWLVSLIKPISIFLFSAAIISAPIAPSAEASVGVATPAIIEPRTKKIKDSGRPRVLKISNPGRDTFEGLKTMFELLRFL